ncbi:hypothetical protein BDV95DRAFT_594838 [Massariosphaeria phaeospora]|uniref:WSC domain-containing protein n=1 Tax=Massariosphaeria phaeospora TaxID=100035 RepID=A0A7C8MF40_9PLEO|nr:hypothetical protein BDV95DRAFT_594838 [Massariosphaeria phaeospora]
MKLPFGHLLAGVALFSTLSVQLDTPAPRFWAHSGCFTIGVRQAVGTYSTAKLCTDRCLADATNRPTNATTYIYAGLRGISTDQRCFCDMDINPLYPNPVASTSCNVACATNATESCGGGAGFMTVYKYTAPLCALYLLLNVSLVIGGMHGEVDDSKVEMAVFASLNPQAAEEWKAADVPGNGPIQGCYGLDGVFVSFLATVAHHRTLKKKKTRVTEKFIYICATILWFCAWLEGE